MSSERDQEEIRKRLTAFAATVPDHGLSDFGQLVEVEAVQSFCVHLVTLETDYEERALLKREKPDDGSTAGLTDRATIGPEADVWDAVWDGLVNDEQPGTYEHPLPGSARTIRCGTCVGHGAVSCDQCAGRGAVRCSCQGGRLRCGGCGGSGQTITKKRSQYWARCPWCDGHLLKSNDCSTCHGKVFYPEWRTEEYTAACGVCDGERLVACGRCGGDLHHRCQH